MKSKCDEKMLSYSAVVSSKTSGPAVPAAAAAVSLPKAASQESGQSNGSGSKRHSGGRQARKERRAAATASERAEVANRQSPVETPSGLLQPEIVEEPGWEPVSGSKTFKRNRKNRSSVKSTR